MALGLNTGQRSISDSLNELPADLSHRTAHPDAPRIQVDVLDVQSGQFTEAHAGIGQKRDDIAVGTTDPVSAATSAAVKYVCVVARSGGNFVRVAEFQPRSWPFSAAWSRTSSRPNAPIARCADSAPTRSSHPPNSGWMRGRLPTYQEPNHGSNRTARCLGNPAVLSD